MNRQLRRALVANVSCLALVATMVTPVTAATLGDTANSTLKRQPLVTPEALASPAPPNLQYPDPTSGLSLIDPPTPSSSGSASLSYPITLPKGRGITPQLSIDYDSGNGGSWVGHGWDFGVGEVTVDTSFGVPRFCPRVAEPVCGNFETESYRLNGELLTPNAVTSNPQPRVAERHDWTRRVETAFERIERHGSTPKDYTWEVTDKDGNVSFYGMYPDSGGFAAAIGTRPNGDEPDPATRDDKSLATSAIVTDGFGKDGEDNIVTWYLKAKRDVGVNMFRYEYETVYYRATKTPNGNATRWDAVARSDCTPQVTCAKHVYLSKIFYTGAAEESPAKAEDPAYEIVFERGARRVDATIDARGGYLDLDIEKLTAIKVYSMLPDETRTPALEYRLTYSTGRYGKEFLSTITQVGCAPPTEHPAPSTPPHGGPDPGTCDESTAASHTFTYHDDSKGKTLAAAHEWNTQNDEMGKGRLEERASALGMSATNAGDGHLYLGFNLVDPSKTGSFGGSITFDASTTESLLEFMDINGDGLPDKIFRKEADLLKDAPLYYRPNTSKPSDDPNAPMTFGAATEIDGLKRLPIEHEVGFGAAIEAFLVVSASFSASGSWNWTDGYFNDVNGDGLPDFIKGGNVLFNHLTCSGAGDNRTCHPHFGAGDAATRVPMTTQAVSDPDAVAAAAKRRETLRRLTPPIDTVKRWIAPFDGHITITSKATLLPCLAEDTGGGACPTAKMRLAIQHDATEVVPPGLLAQTGDEWNAGPDFDVKKGERVYFRVGADPDFVGRSVAWTPTITYDSFDSGPATPPIDANGLSQKVFSAEDDFTLAGRPGGFVGLPAGGTVLFGGVIEKGETSDDVRPTVTLHPGAAGKDPVDVVMQVIPVTSSGNPDPDRLKSYAKDASGKFCVSDGAGTAYGCFSDEADAGAQLQLMTKHETGRFVLGAAVDAAAPVRGSDGSVKEQDRLAVRFATDSPIDVTALQWTQPPRLCYGTASAGCDPTKPDLTPPVDTDIYPGSTDRLPRAPWRSTVSGDRTAHVTFDVGDLSKVDTPGQIALTVKSAAHGYVVKKLITPVSGKQGSTVDVTVPLTKDTDYWFDLSIHEPGLGEKVSNAAVTVTVGGSNVTVPVSVNTVSRQGYFPLPYRGWGAAGYLANEGRDGKALIEDDFRLVDAAGEPYDNSDEACKALTGKACMTEEGAKSITFPGTYSTDPDTPPTFDPETVASKFSKAYGYIPQVRLDKAGLLQETWRGPNDHLGATRLGLSSALLGGGLPTADGSGGLTPPQLEGSTGPVLVGTLGFGPGTASFGFGWSRSFVDYMDMNGDGFPDKVTTDRVTYTNPRGGQACKKTDGSFAACKGTGVAAVNQDTTFSLGGGFDGAPVGIKGNARGVPNATQGASASKGGGTSAKEYGAGVGAGVGVSASFGSPNAADPNWDSGKVDPKASTIPGNPVHNDEDLAIQQLLADVNGDGLPDRVKTTPKGVFVWFNLGYGFATNSVPWASGGFESSEGYSGAFNFGIGFSGPAKDFSGGISRNASINFPRYSWADVNGDGILDALHRDDTNGTVQIAYGTGTGLTDGADLGVDGGVPFRLAGEIKVPIEDQIRQDQSVGWGGGFDFTIGFGPLCISFCYLIVNPGVHFENSLGVSDVDLQDVNGDGYADSVRRVPAQTTENQERLDVQLNTHGRTGLLETVTNPLHGKITLDYERYGNTSSHPGSTWALSSVSVDDARPGDGANVARSTITYQGLGYDFLRREELGFARVQTDELGADDKVARTTVQTFHNDTVFSSGLLATNTVYAGPLSDGKRMQETLYAWDVLDGETRTTLALSGLTPDEALAVWAVPQRTDETQRWFAPDGATVIQTGSTHYDYDAMGSPTTILDRGDPALASDDLTATITYSDCAISANDPDQAGKCDEQLKDTSKRPAFWDASLCPTWVHIAARYKVTDATGNLVRYRDGALALCDNDSMTRLDELISGTIDNPEYATTLLNYDSWGSYDRIVYPKGANQMHYAVEYVYDTYRQADVATVTDYEMTDAEAQAFIDDGTRPARTGLTSTSQFDGPAGKMSSSTDPNQQTVLYDYDPMGRLQKVTTADKKTITFDYHPTDAAYAYATARHTDAFAPAGADADARMIDTATFVDGTGRVTQRKREAEFFSAGTATARGFVISPPTAYDALGREVKQFYPQKQLGGALTTHQANPSDLSPHTVNVFDGLDRVTSSTAPGARTTTTVYGAAADLGRVLTSTTETDPKGRATRTLADLRGNVRVSEDLAPGKSPVRTEFGYTPMGDLTKVSTAGVTQSENTYDLLGRRLSTSTPDGGTTTYEFDAAGHQVSSTSPEQKAGGRKTVLAYAFDNLVSITYEPAQSPEVTLGWGGYDGVPTSRNGAGRLVAVRDKARTQRLTYDANGQQTTETTSMNDDHWKRGNVTTTFSHDYLGRLRTVGYIDGETVTNGYDAGGSLARISGRKSCTERGTLLMAIDATQTTISVLEPRNVEPPVVPFTVRIDGEQLRVTARTTQPGGIAIYTVERGINGTLLTPTAVAHLAGAAVTFDRPLICTYRYLDRQEYDEFGDIAFRQLGNGNQTWSERYSDTRNLRRVVSTAPAQGTSLAGTLAAAASASIPVVSVKEAYAPPPVPFAASLGSERVIVTERTESPTKGVFLYTVVRGQQGTGATAHSIGEAVLTDRVQQNLTYTYDKVSNLETYLNDLPADVSSLFGGRSSQQYVYDPYYRVKEATGTWDTAPSTRRSYSLLMEYDDASGNLMSKTQSDSTQRSTCRNNCTTSPVDATSYSLTGIGYRSAEQHQFTTVGGDTYTYDRNGSVVSVLNVDNLREMAWDDAGRMTTIVDRPNGTGGKPTFYTYDYEGNRAIEDKEAGRTWFVNPWTTVRDGTMWKNIWAGDERLGTKFSESGYEHKSYFFQKDLQGSTNVVSDERGSMFQHQEYFPDGEVWVDEASTIFRSPYQAVGAYFDEDHQLSDLGQRWFDARHQAFLNVDPALYDDPMSAVEDPTASWTYTYAGSNPLVYTDPDGRAKKFINPTVKQRDALTKSLTIDGQPLAQADIASINRQLGLHRGLKGKLLFAALSNVDSAQKRQKMAEKFETKPVIEFTFDLGADKLKNVKLKNVTLESVKIGGGTGPRKKIPISKAAKAAKAQKATQKSNGGGGNP